MLVVEYIVFSIPVLFKITYLVTSVRLISPGLTLNVINKWIKIDSAYYKNCYCAEWINNKNTHCYSQKCHTKNPIKGLNIPEYNWTVKIVHDNPSH